MINTILKGICLLTWCTQAFAVNVKDEVVYGNDDRQIVNSSMDKRYLEMVKKIAPAIAVLVDSSELRRGKLIDSELGKESIQQVIVPSIARDKNLCQEENFRDTPSFGSCTGFLVGEDLLLTAGHCIKGPLSCKKKKWIFDYRQEVMTITDYKTETPALFSAENNKSQVETPPKNNRYFKMLFPVTTIVGCKEIVRRVDDAENKIDFALIRLDRKMTDRSPLKYRTTGKISDEAQVMVVGHPWGMPLTLAPAGTIRRNADQYFFQTNTDTFSGNSGSPVINMESLEVEGVLVRGETDSLNTKHGEGDDLFYCKKVKSCKENECDGEEATRITSVPDLILPPEVLKVLGLSESYSKDQVDNADTPTAQPICLPADPTSVETQSIPPLTTGDDVSWDQINEALFTGENGAAAH